MILSEVLDTNRFMKDVASLKEKLGKALKVTMPESTLTQQQKKDLEEKLWRSEEGHQSARTSIVAKDKEMKS